MSFKDAAEKILRRAKKALHYEEITRLAIKGRLIDSSGRTPGATMIARLGVDVNTLKGRSRFVRVAPGVFGINPHPSPLPSRPRKGSAIGKPGRIGFDDKPVEWSEVIEYLKRACRFTVLDPGDDWLRDELYAELVWAVGKVNDNHRDMATKDPKRFWRIIKSAVFYHRLRVVRKHRKIRAREVVPGDAGATLVFDHALFSLNGADSVRDVIEEEEAVRKATGIFSLLGMSSDSIVGLPSNQSSAGAVFLYGPSGKRPDVWREIPDPEREAKPDPVAMRNRSIFLLREADPARWTYGKLAKKYGIKSIGHIGNIVRSEGCTIGNARV